MSDSHDATILNSKLRWNSSGKGDIAPKHKTRLIRLTSSRIFSKNTLVKVEDLVDVVSRKDNINSTISSHDI